MIDNKPHRLAIAILAALVGAPVPALVHAQEEPSELDRIEVTGSRIKRTDVEGPSPVIVIGREEFERQGYRTVQEVLGGLVQNTGGTIDQGFVFGFTPGASAISLRAFGAGRVLTLLDGRRLPIYPLGIGGSTNFVDTANIPTAIIDRVEILTDGASAIYGSDAVSGVINIITRRDFDGFESRVRYGDTFEGGYQVEEGDLVGGTSSDRTSVLYTLQYSYNEELLSRDREYAASDVANPRGLYSFVGSNLVEFVAGQGFVVTPDPNCGTANDSLGGLGIDPNTPGAGVLLGVNTCSFDRTAFRQLFPSNRRTTMGGRVEHELTDNLRLFSNLRYTTATTRTQIEPFPYTATGLFGGGSADPLVPNNGGLFTGPNGGVAGYARRLVEFGPRSSDIETQTWGVNLGVEGRIGYTFDWEFAVAHNRQSVFSQRPNFILSAFEAEIENGLDLFQRIPQEVVDRVSYIAVTDGDSIGRTADFSFSGDSGWELPGGVVRYAGILDYAYQKYSDIRDPITLRGDSADGGSSGRGSRDHYGAGIEVALPLTSSLQVDLAGRYDDYNDASAVGGAFSPRIALQWRPLDNLLLRGSAGRSFRAPDMQRLFGAQTRAFSTVIDTPTCIAQGGSGAGDPSVPSCTQQIQSVRVLAGSNIDLSEERGTNFNVGVVWEPIDGWSLTADAYRIELEDIVAAPSAQFVLNQCAAGDTFFCGLIFRDPNTGLQGGEIRTQAQNLSVQEIRGIDLSSNYGFDTGFGSFRLGAQVAWVDSLKTQFTPDSPVLENVGVATIPEWRANVDVNWSHGPWGATLRTSYVGRMPGLNASNDPDPDEFIGSYTTANLQLRREFDALGELVLGINNLFDRNPAEDPTNNQWPWFVNAGGYSIVQGREWYVQWRKTW